MTKITKGKRNKDARDLEKRGWWSPFPVSSRFSTRFLNSAFFTILVPGLMVYGMAGNGQGRFEDLNVFVFHFFAKFFQTK